MDIQKIVLKQARAAHAASYGLAALSTTAKNKALGLAARSLLSGKDLILKANAKDVAAAKKAGLSAALLDRLTLDDWRIRAMADGIHDIARLKDPVGERIQVMERPNGLRIEKVRVPIGVVAIIYEARPNVTADCAALCLKSGNAVILKGGKEALETNKAIHALMVRGVVAAGVPAGAIQFMALTDREAVTALLKLDAWIDLVVPRGGEGLIRFVAENSRIPVIKHYKGVCHLFVSARADLDMAAAICMNAKVQRPGVCNAIEKLLVAEKIAARFLPPMIARLRQAGVEIRGDAAVRRIVPDVKRAVKSDWYEEYLDLVLTVKVVKDVAEAIGHINTYGSRHSDAIVTADAKEGQQFLNGVDAACVYVNASTRFTDGYEFGLGAEVGISTDKIHVRGPMGLEGLTSYKYQVHGQGQVRA